MKQIKNKSIWRIEKMNEIKSNWKYNPLDILRKYFKEFYGDTSEFRK
jgi:hypothetical protein